MRPAGFCLVALLTTDPERAQRFVADHLGKLAVQNDETLADLRATALCYLESGCSLVKTAAVYALAAVKVCGVA